MRGGLFRLAICIALLGIFLIAHVERQNELTRLRLQIPQIHAQVRRLQESALQLESAVKKSQSPRHLLALLEMPEYQHLHFPPPHQLWIIQEEKSPL